MKDDAALSIARALVDYATARKKTEPGFTMTMTPLAEALRPLLEAEFPKQMKAARKAVSRWRGEVTDAEWLDELEQDPALRFIDVRRELGKCQLWAKGARLTISRQRFIAWLLKAQPTVGYDAQGKSSTDAKRPKSNAPVGWLRTLNRIAPDCVYAKGSAFEIEEESDYAWGQLPAALRAQILGQ
jgi:hypothetical protein